MTWDDVERQLKLVTDLVNGAQPEVRLERAGYVLTACLRARLYDRLAEVQRAVRRLDESAEALQRAAREAAELSATIADYAAEFASRAERMKATVAAALDPWGHDG